MPKCIEALEAPENSVQISQEGRRQPESAVLEVIRYMLFIITAPAKGPAYIGRAATSNLSLNVFLHKNS